MPLHRLCEPVCVCLHLLSSCRTSWLISGKGWKKKRNIKDIKFFYLSWNLAAGERRDVFEMSWPRKRTTWLILRQGKLCKLMNESTALSLLQKSSRQNPRPCLRNQRGQEEASVDLVLIGHKVSSEKIEAGEIQFITEENIQRVLAALFFLRALSFFLILVPLIWNESFNLCHLSTLDCTSLILFDAAERGRSDGMWHALYLEYYLSLQECGEMKPQKSPA